MSILDQPTVNLWLFGIYPYIGLVIFFLGSLIRFDYGQYTWKSDSSQILRRRELVWGSNLFHGGILFLFFGHLIGLLLPHAAYVHIISAPQKQLLAMISGGLAGVVTLAGIALLIHRRVSDPRIRATSGVMDYVVLFWILVALLLGLSTIWFSGQHPDGSMMIRLATWAQHIWSFSGDAQDALVGVPVVYKVHLIVGMTLFVLFPFSRLVHIWSGFAAIAYVGRPYQIVRPRGRSS